MVQIIPTLFATNEEDYKNRLAIVSTSPSLAEGGWVQLDLMDGKFVPNKGISVEVIKKYPVPFKREAQLMVSDPLEWIDGLLEDKVERIVFPIEISGEIGKILKYLEDKVERGLSVNPDTPIEKINEFLGILEAVLLMGVNPGLENQSLSPDTASKIRYIKSRDKNIKVGVDGGVKDSNARELMDAGADYLAVGSFLFEGDFDENFEKIWEALA
jgi:ribulose-phosphate 3-epimerase